jgi:hypothetical protein
LTLAESKPLLRTLQRRLLQQQSDALLTLCSTCQGYGRPLKLKAGASRSFRPSLAPSSWIYS